MAARATIRIGDNQKVEFIGSFVGQYKLGDWKQERRWFYRYQVRRLSCWRQLVVDRFVTALKVSLANQTTTKIKKGG
jgi:hypothetical protein